MMIFFNSSLRTRLSTQKAAMNLGMNVMVLDVTQGAWKLETERGVVMDGRDIGTVVLPHAGVKIFLTASPEERARRRYRQQIEKGDMTPYEQVLAELNARDAQDMNRETDPLRQAEDAVLVDSTNMTPEQVVDAIIAVVEDVYGKRA